MVKQNTAVPQIVPILGVVPARKAIKAAVAAAGQPAFPGFVYNGGTVITSPIVNTSFWGALWSDAAHQTAAQRLNLYVQDLLASNFMNVLSQYGVGKGAGSGQFGQTSFLAGVANQLTDSDIQSNIQQAINAGQIPEPPANNQSQVLLIYLGENTGGQRSESWDRDVRTARRYGVRLSQQFHHRCRKSFLLRRYACPGRCMPAEFVRQQSVFPGSQSFAGTAPYTGHEPRIR